MQPIPPVDTPPVDNPFALLLNPADILAQIERSERLRRLHSRICRPLDKPLIPVASEADFISEDEEPGNRFG